MTKHNDIVRLARILCELNDEDPNQEFLDDEVTAHEIYVESIEAGKGFLRWETRYDRAKELLIEHEAIRRFTI